MQGDLDLGERIVLLHELKRICASRKCKLCGGSMGGVIGVAKREIKANEGFRLRFDKTWEMVESSDIIPAYLCAQCEQRKKDVVSKALAEAKVKP